MEEVRSGSSCVSAAAGCRARDRDMRPEEGVLGAAGEGLRRVGYVYVGACVCMCMYVCTMCMIDLMYEAVCMIL